MAVKTITIDLEAYTLLARHKKDGQSFSEVIKAHFGRQPTAGDFRTLAREIRLTAGTLDAIDAQVARRKSDPARAPRR